MWTTPGIFFSRHSLEKSSAKILLDKLLDRVELVGTQNNVWPDTAGFKDTGHGIALDGICIVQDQRFILDLFNSQLLFTSERMTGRDTENDPVGQDLVGV